MDDEHFRAGLVAGTDEAFHELRRLHAHAMFIACKRVLGNDQDAADAMQDAFIRAFEKRAQLAAADNIKGYIVTVALHIAIDRVRKQKRRNDLVREHFDDSDDSVAPDASSTTDARTRAAFGDCLAALDPITRAMVLAFGDGESSWETIGEPAKLTADAARMRVSRGIKALRNCMRKKGVGS